MNRIPAARLLTRVAASGLALCLALPAAAQSLPPGVLKLHSRGTTAKSGNEHGAAVAVSDTWMVVGEPLNNDRGAEAGAAHVYLATTGRYVRTLVPSDAGVGAQFGFSVAISGPLALVGDLKKDGTGAAYVFDLATGRQLAKLSPPDGAVDDLFGTSVALRGNLALVGAPYHSNSRGAAYLFHARTGGAPLGKIVTANAAAAPLFGRSVALDGRFALIGAPFADPDPGNADGDEGAAFLHDVSGAFLAAPSFPLLATLSATDGSATNGFGFSVALSGHKALVGAPYKTGFRGSAYLFEAATGQQIHAFTDAGGAPFDFFGNGVGLNGSLAIIGSPGKGTAFIFDGAAGSPFLTLTPPDASGTQFGIAVSVAGNRVLVGANADDDLGNNAGAAYLFRPVSIPLPLSPVAKVGDFAPGAVEANFAGFTAAYLNDEAEVGLSAALSNRSGGVWSQYAGPLRPALRPGDDLSGPLGLAGVTAAGYGEIIPEDVDGLLVQTFLRGPGIGRANNLAWLRHTGLVTVPILRQGGTFAELTGAPAFLGFPEVVQKPDSGHVLVAYSLARSATTGTTVANDSGVTYRDENGNLPGGAESDTRHREGEAAPTGTVGDIYGQFFGRVALSPGNGFFAFPAFYLDTSPADPLPDVVKQGVFFETFDADTTGVVARQGQSPVGLPGVPAPTYRAFLGEAMADSGYAVFRALITGTGITRFNDEGIFSEQTQSPYLREGQEIDQANAPGVVIGGFFGYWPVEAGNKIIALVKLRGPGVNKANDCAVVLAGRTNNYLQTLLREGDLATTDDASLIAAIQRVDVDSVNGHYHILAALTGSKARNQALFQGNAEFGNDTTLKGQRLPAMVLRKGQGYQQSGGETSTIKTLTMPISTDRTGAGAKGHGQAINNQGEVVITLEFANRAREVWKGKP